MQLYDENEKYQLGQVLQFLIDYQKYYPQHENPFVKELTGWLQHYPPSFCEMEDVVNVLLKLQRDYIARLNANVQLSYSEDPFVGYMHATVRVAQADMTELQRHAIKVMIGLERKNFADQTIRNINSMLYGKDFAIKSK